MANGVRRIFVEKRPEYDAEAKKVLDGIKTYLGVENAVGVRIVHCYDVEGLSDNQYAAYADSLFAESTTDIVTHQPDIPQGAFAFGKRLLPGQYDQRADYAAQYIQAMTGQIPLVWYSKFYIVTGNLDDKDKAAIVKYHINPIECTEVGLEIPETLKMNTSEPTDVADIPIISKNDEEIAQIHARLGLAMNVADLIFIRNYFRDEEGRDPTATEIAAIDTYWSDHCRHTTFHAEIENIVFEDGPYKELFEKSYKGYLDARKTVYGDKDRPVSLMDMATMGMKALRKAGLLDDLDDSEEVNAASIVITVDVDGVDEEWLLMFKNETHNHPTEMEPLGGAGTCLGGGVRDPLSGRSYVYQAMRVTGSGDPRTPISETLPGKLPQRVITTEAAKGYSSYGGQLGIAAGIVSEIYHPGYVAKRMEVGALVAAAKKENVIRKRPKPGDVVILVGGRTGRDGIGGATGSSREQDDDALATLGAEVQKGDPVLERKIVRLFRNPDAARLILRCNDFGAGGVSVAIGELADSLEINLDNVRAKYDGMNGTELAIAESQERMAVVVDAADADKFIEFARRESLEAYPVAKVTDTGRLIMHWRGKEIVNISREFLNTSGVRQTARVTVVSPSRQENTSPSFSKQAWLKNLSALNVASQKGLIEMFDATVGAGTILAPLGGKYQLTPAQVMAAKIPLLHGETTTASLMSFGYDPYISQWSTFHGAAFAVIESISRLVAAGADYRRVRLSFQEYFERLRDEKTWGKPFAALLGAFGAQMALGTASIGGKDSMSGTFKDIHVPPTLISFAVCTAGADDIISPEFKKAGNTVALLQTPCDEHDMPDYAKLRSNYELLNRLILEKKVVSAHAAGFGGIAAAVSKMAFGNKIGVQIDYDGDFFSPAPANFVLEICGDAAAENLLTIGKTTDSGSLVINGESMCINECIAAWTQTLEGVFPTTVKDAKPSNIKPSPVYTAKNIIVAKNKVARPNVLIPIFPGTNIEWDVARKFEEVGAVCDLLVINNLSPTDLEESVAQLAQRIGRAQIVAVLGDSAAGDEPEGSGMFIGSIFKKPAVGEALTDFLDNRDGLMIGISSGFQALLKLGLVPHGKITAPTVGGPALAPNTIGRHASGLVSTKIISNKSPWFAGVGLGDVHTVAASHGQGRFVADPTVVSGLFENGQVAAVYVDHDGNATEEFPHNPGGSVCGIEAVTSPDGRVLGKMCHSERGGLYKNIPGNFEQMIFKSGVKYFS
ncbi:MAG: phosphoribosylformylglycinamidine synthase [Defluviitaleaceae bacterium]|nr:phosphoribosylformylglycinamidine synthase [Defluviitaleaceae bacterium]